MKFKYYTKYRLLKWSIRNNLSICLTLKIFNNINFYDNIRINTILTNYINCHKDVFINNDTYITSFGETAKSGFYILSEIRNKFSRNSLNFIESWQIPTLPKNSIIILVDDIIGTGKQSEKYIKEKLFQIMNSSHRLVLFTLLGTEDGIEYVKNNTGIEIWTCEVLTEKDNHYSEKCNIFSNKERETLIAVNNKLYSNQSDYDKGLLVCFSYSVPNNSMPIIWKDGFEYSSNGVSEKWFALFPRKLYT
ncbi:MAG: hypothetical protein HPY53_12180 [Brevinematales bacterium]|nr:hypothetical protein [Brevinematales bacterium]